MRVSSGASYYRARYYDPTNGRFVSGDPAGFSAGVNFYAYVWNSPLDLTDPLGLSPRCRQNDYCKYQGKAPPPSDFFAKGKAFKDEIDMMHQFSPQNDSSTDAFALGQLYGDFHRGGVLDAQQGATGTPLQQAAYGNYAFGAFFAGAGMSLSDALSAANGYGFKQQLFNGAYKGRYMDPEYTHIPAANAQDITNGYLDALRGMLCGK